MKIAQKIGFGKNSLNIIMFIYTTIDVIELKKM